MTPFFVVPLAKTAAAPQWQSLLLPGKDVPAPTLTPSTALTCAGVSSEQAFAGGAAEAAAPLPRVNTPRMPKANANLSFEFILSASLSNFVDASRCAGNVRASRGRPAPAFFPSP